MTSGLRCQPFIDKHTSNSVTTLVVVAERIISGIPTCEKAIPCSRLNLSMRGCKLKKNIVFTHILKKNPYCFYSFDSSLVLFQEIVSLNRRRIVKKIKYAWYQCDTIISKCTCPGLTGLLDERTENGNGCLDQSKHKSHTFSGYKYKRTQSARKLSIHYGKFKTFRIS